MGRDRPLSQTLSVLEASWGCGPPCETCSLPVDIGHVTGLPPGASPDGALPPCTLPRSCSLTRGGGLAASYVGRSRTRAPACGPLADPKLQRRAEGSEVWSPSPAPPDQVGRNERPVSTWCSVAPVWGAPCGAWTHLARATCTLCRLLYLHATNQTPWRSCVSVSLGVALHVAFLSAASCGAEPFPLCDSGASSFPFQVLPALLTCPTLETCS